jgi:hypothetical protein
MTMSLERAKGFFSRSDKLARGVAVSFCAGKAAGEERRRLAHGVFSNPFGTSEL